MCELACLGKCVCKLYRISDPHTKSLTLTYTFGIHINLYKIPLTPDFVCLNRYTQSCVCYDYCNFPLDLLWVFEDKGHMTPDNYFPVRVRFILRSAKIVAVPFCIPSHPQFFSHPLLFSRQKNSRQSWLKFVTGHGSALRKKIGRKRSTFRQLPTNESPWCMSVKKIESTPCTATKRRFKGGQPFEKEINEILGSKREDRLSDPFFELIQNTTLVRFSYLLRLCNFCKVLRDMRKFPQKCQKIGGCWGRAVYVHNFWSLQHLAHPLRNDRV